MTTSMEQEKQRISERLARLDAEREKLGTQPGRYAQLRVFCGRVGTVLASVKGGWE